MVCTQVNDTHVERGYESVTGFGPRSVEEYASFVVAHITKLGLPLEDQHAHAQRVREGLKKLLEQWEELSYMAITLTGRLLRDAIDTADTLQRCIDGRNKTMIIITCCRGENLITSLPLDVQEKILEELPGKSHLNIGIFSEKRDRLRLPDSLTAEDMNAEPASRAALRAPAALPQMLGTGPATTPSVPQAAKGLSDIPEEILCGIILSGLPSVALARWSETSREHMRATSGVREEVKIQMCTLDPKTYFPYVTAATQKKLCSKDPERYAQYASQASQEVQILLCTLDPKYLPYVSAETQEQLCRKDPYHYAQHASQEVETRCVSWDPKCFPYVSAGTQKKLCSKDPERYAQYAS